MRNRLAHEYDNIDLETVWEAATIHVPILANAVARLLNQGISSRSNNC